MSELFLLDTNIISNIAFGRSQAADKRFAEELANCCTSVICNAEILYGLERRPENTRLREVMLPMLVELRILDWTSKTAAVYAVLRSSMERDGKALAALDMLIVAHALEAGATLVSNDGAFRNVPGLAVEDWTVA